jgi:hypothetical protein
LDDLETASNAELRAAGVKGNYFGRLRLSAEGEKK